MQSLVQEVLDRPARGAQADTGQLQSEFSELVMVGRLMNLLVLWKSHSEKLRADAEFNWQNPTAAQMQKSCAVVVETCIRELAQAMGLQPRGDYVVPSQAPDTVECHRRGR